MLISAEHIMMDQNVSRSVAQRILQTLCKRCQLLRISKGKYIYQHCYPENIPPSLFPWWGSKRKLCLEIASIVKHYMLQTNSTHIISLFAGSAIVEKVLMNIGVPVKLFDLDKNICNIHSILAKNKNALMKCFMESYKTLKTHRDRNLYYKTILRNKTLDTEAKMNVQTAANWLLGTKLSFHGKLNKSSSLVMHKIDKMQTHRVVHAISKSIGSKCSYANAFDVLKNIPDDALVFLDPPYLLKANEGQYHAGDFGVEQHKTLADLLKGKKFILCHRECPTMRNIYKDNVILKLPPIMKLNRVGASRSEMLILG